MSKASKELEMYAIKARMAIFQTLCAIAQRQYERAKTDQEWRDCHELFRIAQLPDVRHIGSSSVPEYDGKAPR